MRQVKCLECGAEFRTMTELSFHRCPSERTTPPVQDDRSQGAGNEPASTLPKCTVCNDTGWVDCPEDGYKFKCTYCPSPLTEGEEE